MARLLWVFAAFAALYLLADFLKWCMQHCS